MRLIAGLGNPDVKYMNTRHNMGFMILDEIIKSKNLKLSEKFKSYFAKDGDILYAMPATYMNLSGLAVAEIMKFFKLDIKDILIVYDDISLPLGTLRFRSNGSDGGHNGIKSIIKEIGSSDFNRLKSGIGPQPLNMPSEKFVLADFRDDEKDKLNKIVKIGADAALDWLSNDVSKLQNLYNKSFV